MNEELYYMSMHSSALTLIGDTAGVQCWEMSREGFAKVHIPVPKN